MSEIFTSHSECNTYCAYPYHAIIIFVDSLKVKSEEERLQQIECALLSHGINLESIREVNEVDREAPVTHIDGNTWEITGTSQPGEKSKAYLATIWFLEDWQRVLAARRKGLANQLKPGGAL
jgi:DNA-binding transcriptional MerR regulator